MPSQDRWASAAVEDAKQCVALNPQWAKGHFRLACAYAALGDRSNDVCQSLQRTLSLDPGNASARQMLLRELRGRGRPRPSAPPADQDPSRETRPDDIPSADTIDETIPWKERLLFQYTRAKDWYHRQSNDAKNMFKVLLALVALYVLFGGRFGLGGFLSGSVERRRGHYGEGNAYDQYHRRQQQPYSYGSSSYQYGSSSYGRRTPPSDDDYGYRYHHPRTSFQFPDLFDGSLLSILALAVFGYLCHRNGISPFQAIWLLNIVTAGGRRRHRRGFRRGWY